MENQAANFIGVRAGLLTISGRVRTSDGVAITGVSIVGLPGPPVTDSSGFYSAQVNWDWSGTAMPTLAGYTFFPPSQTYLHVSADAWGQDYVGAGPGQSVTISGSVQRGPGVPVAGVQMSGLPGDPVFTDLAGSYSATVPLGWYGGVTPYFHGYAFTPSSLTFANVTADATNQNFTAQSICEGDLATAQAQISSLNLQLASANATIRSLQAQIEVLQAGLSQVIAGMADVESDFRLVFKNPLFVIPGDTPVARSRSLTVAILGMTRGEKNPIYQGLFDKR